MQANSRGDCSDDRLWFRLYRWLADREAEFLPIGYFRAVYTLPAELRDVAFQNKRVVYDILMKAAAGTTLQIAADPRHLGARVGITAVLNTWGSAMTPIIPMCT
jgi:hypothetical protein